jgi:Flp pilus assembly protein protease CpaA
MFIFIKIFYDFLAKNSEIILKEWQIILTFGFLCSLLGGVIIFLWYKQKMDILTAQTDFLEKQLAVKNEPRNYN